MRTGGGVQMASKAVETDLVVHVSRPTIVVLLAFSLIALIYLNLGDASFIASYFFLKQDLPAVIVFAAFTVMMRGMLLSPRAMSRLNRVMAWFERLPVWAIAAFVGCVAAAGVWLVFGSYPLSMDEFWARADGKIIASGHAMAQIPQQWRDYAPALQPIFARLVADNALWASTYLPVNAGVQGLFGPLASPVMAAFSVVVAADLARRLLPDHPTAPVICALLMMSSSQLLITAMTPYAMTGHLAFNLAWLWLFLHPSRKAKLAALPVAVLAIGLHQAVFFPMFAAPFLFEAFLSGRRGAAVLQGVVIGVAFLCWSAYDAIVFWWLHVSPAGDGAIGTTRMIDRALTFISAFGFSKIALMALNLIRWTVWQNLLAVPLLLSVAWAVVRKPGVWRAMVVGMVLTVLVMTVVMGFQGHGWGYRYLHGMLGSLCLLATYAWFRLIDDTETREKWRAVFAAALLLSLALVPARALMAARFVAPYGAANKALSRVDADVVLIDAPGHFYAVDLVRNDPFLRNRPKRMTPWLLSDAQLVDLCRTYRVALFTDADAERFDLPSGPPIERKHLPAACPQQG
jgi:hypothetical protein